MTRIYKILMRFTKLQLLFSTPNYTPIPPPNYIYYFQSTAEEMIADLQKQLAEEKKKRLALANVVKKFQEKSLKRTNNDNELEEEKGKCVYVCACALISRYNFRSVCEFE